MLSSERIEDAFNAGTNSDAIAGVTAWVTRSEFYAGPSSGRQLEWELCAHRADTTTLTDAMMRLIPSLGIIPSGISPEEFRENLRDVFVTLANRGDGTIYSTSTKFVLKIDINGAKKTTAVVLDQETFQLVYSIFLESTRAISCDQFPSNLSLMLHCEQCIAEADDDGDVVAKPHSAPHITLELGPWFTNREDTFEYGTTEFRAAVQQKYEEYHRAEGGVEETAEETADDA